MAYATGYEGFTTALKGLVNGATQASDLISTAAGKGASLVGVQTIAGLVASQVQAALAALAARPFAAVFVSAQYTITNGGLLTIPHGLGATPTVIVAYVVNIVAEDGYSVGDIIEQPNLANLGGAAQGWGVVCKADATNIYCRIGASGMANINWTNGDGGPITSANWKLFFRAYV